MHALFHVFFKHRCSSSMENSRRCYPCGHTVAGTHTFLSVPKKKNSQDLILSHI